MSSHRSRALGAALAFVLVLGLPVFAQPSGFTLSDALAALPKSPSWQKADLDYQSAADALAAARAAAGLQVSAGGSYDRTAVLAGSGTGRSSAKLSVSASATVLPWAPVDASIANAEQSLKIASLNRDSARASLQLTVEQQYFTARLAATAQGVAQAALQQAQAKLVAAKDQHAQGQLSDQGLAQAQAAVASAQASLTQANSTLDLDRRTLFDTLGMPLSDAPLTTAPPQAEAPSLPLDQLVQSGVPKRDDVQLAQVKVSQAQASLAAVSAQRWIPAASLNLGVAGSDSTGSQAGIGVSAGLDFQKGTLTGTASYPVAAAPVGNVSTQLSIGASVSIPLDAPSSDASIRSARTSLASARAALSATEQSASLDIRQSYASYRAAQASLAADQASQAAAKQALDTAQARLGAGLATRLDVGDAQVAYRQAQRSVESDQNSVYLALLQLRNALGELKAPPGGQP
jgi:outer membrane protein